MLNSKELESISNRAQLIQYLLKQQNCYATFILERLDRNPDTLKPAKIQNHHIIPKYRGGSDEKWNFITLTVEEHGSRASL